VVREADRIASTLFEEQNRPFLNRYYIAAAAVAPEFHRADGLR
jgi:hypothetical protein